MRRTIGEEEEEEEARTALKGAKGEIMKERVSFERLCATKVQEIKKIATLFCSVNLALRILCKYYS